MRDYKRPYFQTKQYWGLVEILKKLEWQTSYINENKEDWISKYDLINALMYHLKTDNPKFRQVLFLKAVYGDK